MNHDVPDIHHGQRTLAAIVLTDAVGFSARMSIDEERTLSLIHRDQRLMEKLCRQFEGRVIKSTGDGLLMYFASAVQAVSCGLKIQQDLSHANEDIEGGHALQHRIGIHLGDVFFSESDVMGNGVNIAARLQTEARPGGVCISQIVYDVVKSRLALDATFAGPLRLKNIQEPQPAYHINPIANPVQPPTPATTPSDSVAPSQDKLQPNSKVGGRYVVKRVLGQGGFGRSYLVEDSQRFGEPCVLKEFFPSNASKRSLQKALDLFKREAKTLYQINHPQVPKFLACFTQGQRLFIVQEYIEGVTYSQLLKQRRRQGQRFSEAEVTRWLTHMLQVLEYLHNLNIVHRDISPDNIIYSSDRNLPILIDFGLVNDAMNNLLAGQDDDDDEEKVEGRSATMVGKFGYSPPEQIQLGQCFPASDLYALGVTAIVLLTGQYPRELMDRNSLEWRWQQYVQISRPFIQILNRLIQQKPRERFQSARAVLEAVVALPSNPNASSPLPQTTPLNTVDLSPDPNAAPVFDDPLQVGEATPKNQAFVEQCRQTLTQCIGPMASLVIEDTLEQYPNATPQELVDIIASQLSDNQQAVEFTSRMQVSERTQPQSTAVDDAPSTSSRPVSGSSPSPPSSARSGAFEATSTAVSPEFIDRCRQALVRCVGPMADFLLEETLAEQPHLDPQSLIEHLATEIPDAQKAREFQQQLL